MRDGIAQLNAGKFEEGAITSFLLPKTIKRGRVRRLEEYHGEVSRAKSGPVARKRCDCGGGEPAAVATVSTPAHTLVGKLASETKTDADDAAPCGGYFPCPWWLPLVFKQKNRAVS
jgi:hypothetical protein